MMRHGGLGTAHKAQQWRDYCEKHKWHRTPWWAFWRPAWRRLRPDVWSTTSSWKYQTHKQRARAILEDKFNDHPAQAQQGIRSLSGNKPSPI